MAFDTYAGDWVPTSATARAGDRYTEARKVFDEAVRKPNDHLVRKLGS